MSEVEVILGNSSKRFSGVTSTMLATLPGVSELLGVAVLGAAYVPDGYRVLGFGEMVKMCRQPLQNGHWRVFHARRNDEMIQALIAKKLFGAKIKIIFTSTAQRHHSRFTKWLMGQMDGIITTCEAAGAYLTERKADVTIPHGVDVEEFQPAEDRPGLWKSLGHGGEYGIGMFGRVRPSKGVDLLVRAAIPLLKKDPKPTVVIIGETTAQYRAFQEELQSEIDEAGLSDRILFLGKLPFDHVKTYFQAVSLVTALSRNEGFGLTVLEAMASGTAVLASEAGAWKEIVTADDYGLLVSLDDHLRTREAMESLLSGGLSLESKGERAREQVVKNFSINKETMALCYFYREVQNRGEERA